MAKIKQQKVEKKCIIKRKLKCKGYKSCLEAKQPGIKIINLNNNEIDVKSLVKGHGEFIIIIHNLKSQPRFKSQWHNTFTEEINKIVLNSNDDKRVQSIDSIETSAYRTRKK